MQFISEKAIPVVMIKFHVYVYFSVAAVWIEENANLPQGHTGFNCLSSVVSFDTAVDGFDCPVE